MCISRKVNFLRGFAFWLILYVSPLSNLQKGYRCAANNFPCCKSKFHCFSFVFISSYDFNIYVVINDFINLESNIMNKESLGKCFVCTILS